MSEFVACPDPLLRIDVEHEDVDSTARTKGHPVDRRPARLEEAGERGLPHGVLPDRIEPVARRRLVETDLGDHVEARLSTDGHVESFDEHVGEFLLDARAERHALVALLELVAVHVVHGEVRKVREELEPVVQEVGREPKRIRSVFFPFRVQPETDRLTAEIGSR